MPFEKVKATTGTLSWRIGATYATGFFVGCLLVALSAMQVIENSDARADREEIRDEFEQNSARYRKLGASAYLISANQKDRQEETVLIRVSDAANRTLMLLHGFAESVDESEEVGGRLESVRSAGWQKLKFVDSHGKNWQVFAGAMPDGNWMQVAKSDHQWQQSRAGLARAVLPVFGIVAVMAIGGAAIVTNRSLRPIRALTATTRQVIRSGDMAARVAHGRIGGSELDELTTLFNQMLARSEALIRGMREALDNVAHDLCTPLTRMRASAEAALKANPPSIERRGEALADAVEESERTLGTLRTLMDISEAERGALRLRLESVALADLVAVAVDLYEYVADERQVAVRVVVAPGLRVRADRVRLQQVIANLLDNALKYGRPNTVVHIEGGAAEEVSGRMVWLKVQDQGMGIAGHDLPRIWDRLYRGDRSRSERGTGLGLSVVKAVVEAHGGSVEVETALDVGSTFTIRLAAIPQGAASV